MTARRSPAALPVVAVVVVAAVLGVQVANGGGSFEPLTSADPCAVRSVSSQADGIDGLTERLVLLGVDAAACQLDVSRESFTLEVAQPATRTDADVAALHDGLLTAVQEMKDDGTLPPASDLVDDALATADLNPFLEAAIKALPDSVIDAALKTDDVLVRTIDGLDLEALLANLGRPDDLNAQVEAAVSQAVKDSLSDRLGGLV